MKNNKGFSLIELMIVVAIIGILSAIAIPNFQRFQRKAKQSEARALLTSYHTAAKAHAAEVGCYAGNFVAIGFQPEGTLNYRIEAVDNSTGNCDPTPNDDNCDSSDDACNAVASYKTWTEGASATATGTSGWGGTAAAATTNTTFIVRSGAYLGGGSTTNLDTWTINESKTLTNAVSGL